VDAIRRGFQEELLRRLENDTVVRSDIYRTGEFPTLMMSRIAARLRPRALH
jgi:hypothetical protein